VKIAGIATIDGRQESLKDTVDSLLPQVDKIHISFNDYTSPEWANSEPKVVSHSGVDRGDAGKHFGATIEESGVYFCCDDDLIYPRDYCENLLHGLSRFPGSIVGFHGKVMPPEWKVYHNDAQALPCLGTVPEDFGVHVVGDGCIAYDLSIGLDVQPILDGPRNMSDVNTSVQAQKQGIPLFVLRHYQGWILHTTKINMADTIWERVQKEGGDTGQSELLQSTPLRRYQAHEVLPPERMSPNLDGTGTHMAPLLTAVANTKGRIIEFGCGDYSTPLLHAVAGSRLIYSYETDRKWLDRYTDLRSTKHTLELVEDWDAVDVADCGVILIDHAPAERRIIDIERFRGRAQAIVVHDTDASDWYGYGPVLDSFKYRYDYTRYSKTTAIVSDFRDPGKWFRSATCECHGLPVCPSKR